MNQPEIFFMDTRTKESLTLQCVPLEIQYSPESIFVAITTLGRNNPYYHYIGSEDTLSFELDWFAEEAAKDDVIRKCRWLESKTKADGYRLDPPAMVFKWGELYTTDDLWLLVSAGPIRLSQFDRPAGMLPKQAYQQITLKRLVDKNLEHSAIKYKPKKIYTLEPVEETSRNPLNIIT